jgi:hypothetical protein
MTCAHPKRSNTLHGSEQLEFLKAAEREGNTVPKRDFYVRHDVQNIDLVLAEVVATVFAAEPTEWVQASAVVDSMIAKYGGPANFTQPASVGSYAEDSSGPFKQIFNRKKEKPR